jgi:DNA-binding FadR family transcriptional regulator
MAQPDSTDTATPKSSRDLRLPQVEPTRLYRQIAALISDRIDDGVFPAGSLLPAERDLAQQLGVSRTSVREALIALEVGGKVSIRVGHGVQILEATPRPDRVGTAADAGADGVGPIQLMEARRHIELKTAELAAQKRQPDNLERLEQSIRLQASARSDRDPAYRDGDRAFHLEIARAGGNAAFALVIAALWDQIYQPMFDKFEELLLGPDRPPQTVAEHLLIFGAIKSGDRRAARRAMQAHLDAVLRAFSRGLGAARSDDAMTARARDR